MKLRWRDAKKLEFGYNWHLDLGTDSAWWHVWDGPPWVTEMWHRLNDEPGSLQGIVIDDEESKG